jgi:hypothetical protein
MYLLYNYQWKRYQYYRLLQTIDILWDVPFSIENYYERLSFFLNIFALADTRGNVGWSWPEVGWEWLRSGWGQPEVGLKWLKGVLKEAEIGWKRQKLVARWLKSSWRVGECTQGCPWRWLTAWEWPNLGWKYIVLADNLMFHAKIWPLQ